MLKRNEKSTSWRDIMSKYVVLIFKHGVYDNKNDISIYFPVPPNLMRFIISNLKYIQVTR